MIVNKTKVRASVCLNFYQFSSNKMENIFNICSNKVCRTCLSESSDLTLLNSTMFNEKTTLMEKLCFIIDIQLIRRVNPPGQVCEDCRDVICKAWTFKKRCFEVESLLDQYNQSFSNGDTKTFDFQIKNENLEYSNLDDVPLINFSNTYAQSCRKNEVDIKKCITTMDGLKSSSRSQQVLDHPPIKSPEVKEETNHYFEDSNMEFGTELYDVQFEYEVSENEQLGTQAKNCKTSKGKQKLFKATKKTDEDDSSTCKECNRSFKSAFACKIHQRKHSKTSPSTTAPKSTKSVDESGKFQCSECMRQFKKKSSLASHIKLHETRSNIKFDCLTCKREFKHKAHLENHVLRIHTKKFQKGFACVVCNTNFSTESALELHKDTHLLEKKHQCKLCSKSFHMLSTLTDHLRTHTGEKPYLCSFCGRGFSQKTNLAQHVRRHEGLKPYPCQQCDQRFVSKGELQAHSRKHSGAHPFVCDDCGSGFTTSSSLVKHRRTHTGERPYACDYCPMRFAASGTLKNHRRTHTGEKPHKCSYCDKAFVQRHDLTSHIRCHTGERPYNCSCGQSYRKAAALKSHLKMHSNAKEVTHRGGDASTPASAVVHADVSRHTNTMLQKHNYDIIQKDSSRQEN